MHLGHLQFGVCMWLKPDEPSCFMGEAEHVTLASVKVANTSLFEAKYHRRGTVEFMQRGVRHVFTEKCQMD